MNIDLMRDSLPLMWSGFLITLELFVLTFLLSGLVSLPVAILRLNPSAWIRLPVAWYIRAFRGTPLLVQLFIIYYGLAQLEFIRESWAWPWLRQPFWCALIAFVLNATAYNAHVLRGAIEAVPASEIEAGRACGMSPLALYRCVILPRALLIALPSLGNEVIKNVKRTALASTITISDLTGVANMLVARTFAPVEIFLIAALIYLAFSFLLTRAIRLLEYRMSRHLRPVQATATIPASPRSEGPSHAA